MDLTALRAVMSGVIEQAAEMVVARYASHPLAANANLDPTSLPAWEALGEWLMKTG